jgi:PHD/YefM family antitoxin component YafN of YafNO toxin-antitoxin module
MVLNTLNTTEMGSQAPTEHPGLLRCLLFWCHVNEVAHGHERIVLTSRGRPKAAIVGLEDLAALEDLPPTVARDATLLDEVDALRARILERRGGVVTDSAEDLEVIRAGQER